MPLDPKYHRLYQAINKDVALVDLDEVVRIVREDLPDDRLRSEQDSSEQHERLKDMIRRFFAAQIWDIELMNEILGEVKQ